MRGTLCILCIPLPPVRPTWPILACVTDYGVEVPAMVARGNVFGCQFHPEKSGEVGLKILKNFAALTEEHA